MLYNEGSIFIEEADLKDYYPNDPYGSWVIPDLVKVEYLGIAKEGMSKGVIISSFHAG